MLPTRTSTGIMNSLSKSIHFDHLMDGVGCGSDNNNNTQYTMYVAVYVYNVCGCVCTGNTGGDDNN